MNNTMYPTREGFQHIVRHIEDFHAESERGASEKTDAFDFMDDAWFDEMYGIVGRVMGNDWSVGDGSPEHRIADVMVTINIGHKLPNGNKRSSVLVMAALCLYRDESIFSRLNDTAIYTIAKKVAAAGNEKKDESVAMVRDFLKKQKFIEI